MSATKASGSTRLNPEVAWSVLTDAPLRGLSMAREAVKIFAWDAADTLYVLDQDGQREWVSQAPGRVVAGTVSDDGRLLALLGESRRLWLFGHDLELLQDRETISDPLAVCVDPHGRFALVTSRASLNQFYTAHGQIAGRFESLQPIAHAAFVPALPLLIASAGHGSLFGVELRPAGGGLLEAEVAWRQSLLSNVGKITVTGDGGMILASCFTHGIQRFDGAGRSEGAYHLGGTATLAVPDFIGRLIAATTQEGELAILNRAGNFRWKTMLERPLVGLEMDGLGRFMIHGDESGTITRLDLEAGLRKPGAGAAGGPAAAPVARPAQRSTAIESVRTPAWTVPVAKTEEQAETAVLAILDQPSRIALLTNTNRLRVFDTSGQPLHEGEALGGVGRILRVAPGWIAAATDRQLLLYEAGANTSQRLDLKLVEVTHLSLRPADFGIAVVQERDRLCRATVAGNWVFRKELDSPVEDLAIGPRGTCAVTTDEGQLCIFDAAGQRLPGPGYQSGEAMAMAAAPIQDPDGIVWVTLARHEQVMRGHRLDGQVGWELPVPWVSWQLIETGRTLLVTAPDGRAMAVDQTGTILARRTEESPTGVYGEGVSGIPELLYMQGPNLVCAEVSGRILWRSLLEPGRRPMVVGRAGAAILRGRALAFYPAESMGV